MLSSKFLASVIFVLALGLTVHGQTEFNDPASVIRNVKSRLSQVKLALGSKDSPRALAKLAEVQSALKAWERHIKAESEAGKGGDKKTPPRVSTAVFGTKTTTAVDDCGTSRQAATGDRVRIHYIGKVLPERKVALSSFHTGSLPVRVTLGKDDSIVEGLHKGIVGMCAGERRDVTVPADLAFGKAGKGRVPSNADMLFHVQLVDISGRGEL